MLRQEELVPRTGAWGGVLFENPAVGVPLRLSWWFRVDFETISRSYGDTTPNLQVEWVDLSVPSWRHLEGCATQSQAFGDPIESSVYYFEHHRFEAVAMRVNSQSSTSIDISIVVRGDIDRLGIDSLHVETALEFEGISIHTEGLTADEAVTTLSAFTDTDGLTPTPRGRTLRLRPTA